MPTQMRSVRIEDELWARVTEAAERNGWSRSDIIRAALKHLPESEFYDRGYTAGYLAALRDRDNG